MLTEERQDEIVRLVNVGGAVSVQALVEYFHISEATVRRDLVALQQAGRLRRVHGGATSLNGDNPLYEADMEELTHKYAFHMVEKRQIAQYASSLINDDDFVYLDAGSTVEQMADFLSESKAAFMTNNLPLATKLATNGCHVSILPGRIKGTTAAVVGADMIQYLKKYHFTKGFFGTNGISLHEGCTTPDEEEATGKKAAISQCTKAYVLADPSKFGLFSRITFTPLSTVSVITAKGRDDVDFMAYQHSTEVTIL